ncbi:hypothetical protein [Streptomyces tendae]
MTSHAVRLDAAGANAVVMSDDQAVTDWTARYLGSWWTAAPADAESARTGQVVTATVDSQYYEDIGVGVTRAPHVNVEYAKAMLLVARDASEGVVRAVCPEQRLAYRSQPGRGQLHIVGCDAGTVATATARLTREAVRGQLLRDGWAVLHASAVVDQDGRAFLTFGQKGAGKTTAALTLATCRGLRLLANDRVFVKPDGDVGVEVLPWPSAAAVGLGLLDALGWYEVAQERMVGGEQLHPTQDWRVTAALRAGVCMPLWDKGRELKVQICPDQFERWFSVPLAVNGSAAALVFPRVDEDAVPAEENTVRTLSDGDFMGGQTEDRYPDVFGLLGVDGGGANGVRQEVAWRLGALPHHSVVLAHDVVANADLLGKILGV